MNDKPMLNKSLALAAGGARGAYQAGALQALANAGLRFNAVAGTSVGTLNGAFYVQGDGSSGEMSRLCDLWREIARAGILKLGSGKYPSLLDPEPLRAILDNYLNYAAICRANGRLLITTIPSKDPVCDILLGAYQRPVYWVASNLTPTLLRDALLAATAIPIAFPSIDIQGTHYTDAGLSVPVPSKVLYDEGARFIVSIFLSDKQLQQRLDYPGCLLFQVRPSVNIAGRFESMLDFSPDYIDYLIDLGHEDALAYLKQVRDRLLPLEDMRRGDDELEGLMGQLPV